MLGCKTKEFGKTVDMTNRQKLAAVVILIAGLAAFTAPFMLQAPPLQGNQGTDGNSNSNDDNGTGATGGTDTDTPGVGETGGGDEQGGDDADDNDEEQGDDDDDGEDSKDD